MSTVPYELYPEESASVQVKAVQGFIIYRIVFNPRPAGPLDFPPPAGGGAFERPPHDLGSWSP